jgi:integrase
MAERVPEISPELIGSGSEPPDRNGTLADVIAALKETSTLTPRMKTDFKSGIKCFARVLGLDLATTSASDLARFQSLISGFEPEAQGLSSERWSVIKSQVQRALVTTGFATPMLTANVTLLPGWKALFTGAQSKQLQLALSRFGRFCTQRGVTPDNVSDETFLLFLEALCEGSLVRNPRQVHRHAARAWNQLPDVGNGFVPAKVTILPIIPRDRGLRLNAFPESFQQDLKAYQAWCASADALDDNARAKRLRPQTIISYGSALHSAACAAVKAGVAIEDITSLAFLTSPVTYTKILRQLHLNAGAKANAHATTIATIVYIVAKDWLKQPADDIAEMRRLKSKLPRITQGLTVKNQALLGKFDGTDLVRRFLQLPEQLWKEALSNKLPPRSKLVRAQLAILMALLQIIPVRRKNVCALAFGTHITWPNGPNAPALLQLPSEETKTSDNYVAEVSLEISKWLQIYRSRIAPAAIGKEPVFLFTTSKGSLKRESCVAVLLERILLKRLGIKMTMHQFRHVAAKFLLDDSPGAYETAAQLLGQTGTRSVVRYYGGTNTKRASKHHAHLIESIRARHREKLPKLRGTRKPKGPDDKAE